MEAASRLLVSPLAAPDARTWLYEAGRAVRDFVRGDRVVLLVPGEMGHYHSEDAPEVAEGVHGFVEGATEDDILFSDPVVGAWYRMRARGAQDVLSWDESRDLVERNGYRMRDSPIVSDVLEGQRYRDFIALVRDTPEGDAMIWTLHRQHGGFAFGEQTTAVLGALMPSFRAGLDAYLRLGAHRAALDAVSEPIAAFDADGREIHRNTALSQLLASEPERALFEARLLRMGRSMRLLARPAAGSRMPTATEEIQTQRGRYVLRLTALPPGAFGADPALLITVQADVGTPMPDAAELRARHGLTKREVEVALLLVDGLTNEALAERLFISPHTARHHVENVLAKLGVSSRAAVAARLLSA